MNALLSIPLFLSFCFLDWRCADAASGASVVGTDRERDVMRWADTSGDWQHLLGNNMYNT